MAIACGSGAYGWWPWLVAQILGLWLVACGWWPWLVPGGHGLWQWPWLVAVAMASGRGPSLWPRPWLVPDGHGLRLVAMACGSWTAKLTFVGL